MGPCYLITHTPPFINSDFGVLYSASGEARVKGPPHSVLSQCVANRGSGFGARPEIVFL